MPILLIVLLAAGCSSDGLFGMFGTRSDPVPARNLVVVCIDTLRADHVGAYGYERDTTPHIDALAARGALFEETLAQANWTIPATGSLLTSLYPSEHGAGIEGEMRQLGSQPLSQLREGAETLGQILSRHGFRTGLFSANPYLFGRFKRGFDIAEVSRRDATSLTNLALAWLRDVPRNEPFFLYIQYMDLHQPIAPPEPYFHHFEVDMGGARGPQHTVWRFPRQEDLQDSDFRKFRAHKIALYDGALRYVDNEIGRIAASLQEQRLLDETVLVITSDHGEEFWDHAAVERDLGGDPRQIWGIGHGHTMFQELLHVPLILWGPQVESRRIGCEVRHIDVAPTVLETLGLEPPERMRGRSLLPWLTASVDLGCEAVPQVAESPAYGPDSQALVWKSRKLIMQQDGVTLLFDLRRDPDERYNLADELPDVVTHLAEMLRQELASEQYFGESERIELDAETRRQLRSLGYLQSPNPQQ